MSFSNTNMYKMKYLKYKTKYQQLKGGVSETVSTDSDSLSASESPKPPTLEEIEKQMTDIQNKREILQQQSFDEKNKKNAKIDEIFKNERINIKNLKKQIGELTIKLQNVSETLSVTENQVSKQKEEKVDIETQIKVLIKQRDIQQSVLDKKIKKTSETETERENIRIIKQEREKLKKELETLKLAKEALIKQDEEDKLKKEQEEAEAALKLIEKEKEKAAADLELINREKEKAAAELNLIQQEVKEEASTNPEVTTTREVDAFKEQQGGKERILVGGFRKYYKY